jgi:hypothetical protein
MERTLRSIKIVPEPRDSSPQVRFSQELKTCPALPLCSRTMVDSEKADILISIKPIHMQKIVSRLKTHEFRKYLVPISVKRMWFYTSAPVQCLQYIAIVGNGKEPGQIDAVDTGLGNAEFNAGGKESNYGYEILHLYELDIPLSLKSLKERGFVKGAPQKYQWVGEEMLRSIQLEDQCMLF